MISRDLLVRRRPAAPPGKQGRVVRWASIVAAIMMWTGVANAEAQVVGSRPGGGYYYNCFGAIGTVPPPYVYSTVERVYNAGGPGVDGDIRVNFQPTHQVVGSNLLQYQIQVLSSNHFVQTLTQGIGEWDVVGSQQNRWTGECWHHSNDGQGAVFLEITDIHGRISQITADCEEEDDDIFWFALPDDPQDLEVGPLAVECTGGGTIPPEECDYYWICVDLWIEGIGWVEIWCGGFYVC